MCGRLSFKLIRRVKIVCSKTRSGPFIYMEEHMIANSTSDDIFGAYFNVQERSCPVCGFKDYLCGISSTIGVFHRKTSIDEVKCYQNLYGDLVTTVDHYKERV